MRRIEPKEHKRIVLEALKRRYPGQRFTGRIDGGRSSTLSITYLRESGIDRQEINDFVEPFSGAIFDGMIDLESPNRHWLLPDGTVQLAFSPSQNDGQTPEITTPRPEGAEEVYLSISYIFVRWKPIPEDYLPLTDEQMESNAASRGPLWAEFAFDRIIGESDETWVTRSVDAISRYDSNLASDFAQSNDESTADWIARSNQNIETVRAIAKIAGKTREAVTLPIESQHVESATFEVRVTERELVRREGKLVQEFGRYLASHGLASERKSIPVPGEATSLVTDIFIGDLNLLVEAKGVTSRSHFRMAIGQLRDYVRFHETAPRCGILLPAAPSADLLDLARIEQLFVYWPDGSGVFTGTDPRFPLHPK